jgi:hypothetical protein
LIGWPRKYSPSAETEVPCCVHKKVLLDAVLGQKNPIYSKSTYPVVLRSVLSSDRRTGLVCQVVIVIYLLTLSVSRTWNCRWQDSGERGIVKDFETSDSCQIKVLFRNVCGNTEESHEKLWSVTATPVC